MKNKKEIALMFLLFDLALVDNINSSIETLQDPIDFNTAEKLLNNAIDPFSDAWEEDVEI